jgi:hypothetical protein
MRKVHRKPRRRMICAKWLNYSDPLTAIQGDGRGRENVQRGAEGADESMTSKWQIVRIALVVCGVLGSVLGCGSPDVSHDEAGRTLRSMSQSAILGREEVESLRAHLLRLRAVAQEALDAAAIVGATDHELSAAHRAWAMAERSWQEGHRAYEAGRYQASWEKLQAAEAAFMQAEEHAIRAGLQHIEDELTQAYLHVPAVETPRPSFRGAAVRVLEGTVNLRNGAGVGYQIIGKARVGEMLRILAEAEEWYRVRTEQGTVGWVSKALVVRVE